MKNEMIKSVLHPWQKCILPEADHAEGRISLVVATLGAVDRHNDVIVAGSVGQQPVLISPLNHGIWAPGQVSVGHGILYEADGLVKFDGQYNLDIPTGVENWSAINDAPELHEVSFGLRPIKYTFGEIDGQHCCFLHEIKAYEVSPCIVGAGVGTGVLSIKSAAEGEWTAQKEQEAAAAAAALPSPAFLDNYLRIKRLSKEDA